MHLIITSIVYVISIFILFQFLIKFLFQILFQFLFLNIFITSTILIFSAISIPTIHISICYLLVYYLFSMYRMLLVYYLPFLFAISISITTYLFLFLFTIIFLFESYHLYECVYVKESYKLAWAMDSFTTGKKRKYFN